MRFYPSSSRLFFFAVLLLALLLAPLAPAGLLRTAAAGEDQVELHFGAEEVAITDFLTAVAQQTGKTLVWNPTDKNIRGKKILGGTKFKGKRSEFFSMVRSFLTFYELAMIPVGPPEYEVILVMDARQTSSILKLKPQHVVLTEENLGEFEHADGLFITTTIAVENITDLRNARNALTRIVTGQNIGNVTEVPAARSFVVTDFAPNVVAIYRLLQEMDKPSTSSSTTSGETVALVMKHARAPEVAAVLSRHFAADPAQPQKQRVPGVRPSAPRISADERTNKVLVTGTAAQIETVKQTITQLDVPMASAAPRRVAQATPESHGAFLVRLKNIQAGEAAMALTRLIGSSAPTMFDTAQNTMRPAVVAHNETNGLLISATAKQYEALSKLIAAMDKVAVESK